LRPSAHVYSERLALLSPHRGTYNQGAVMDALEQYTEFVDIPGRPGSRLRFGMSTWGKSTNEQDPVVQLWIAKPDGSGDYDPHSSFEAAKWTLDIVLPYAYRL